MLVQAACQSDRLESARLDARLNTTHINELYWNEVEHLKDFFPFAFLNPTK